MRTQLLAGALIGLTALTVGVYPLLQSAATTVREVPTNATTAARRIEVVFVLDTTSSMTGLIEAAKEKIWSIATTLAQAEQTPEIHMGLVAFRDRGDDYVTQVVDLSPDLDSMYATLMQFQAIGGGDGPESVNQALDEAVQRISWSQNPSTYRVMFLVGDAPPHMDYNDESQYPEIVRSAVAKGIVINTIQCGEVQQTIAPWTQIAALGNGRYMKVGQGGDTLAVATPYDAELADLSAALDKTRLFYGSEDQRADLDAKVSATEELHGAASVAARARRAVFNATAAGVANLFGEQDLLDDLERGEIALEDVPADNLPDALRPMTPEERKSEVAAIAGRRAELRDQIDRLTDARADYIAEQISETEGVERSLDRQIFDVVREQAEPLGLTYEGGPEF